jgi:hypothetical protein
MVVEPEAEFSATLAFLYNTTCSSSRTTPVTSIQQQQYQQAGEKLLYELVNAADSVVSVRTIELNDDAAADIEMLQLRPFQLRPFVEPKRDKKRFDDDRLLNRNTKTSEVQKGRSTETKKKTPEKTPEANPKSKP